MSTAGMDSNIFRFSRLFLRTYWRPSMFAGVTNDTFFHTARTFSDSVGATDTYTDYDPLIKADSVGVTDGQSYTATIFPQPGTEFIAPQRIISFDAPKRPEIPAVQRDMTFDAPVRKLEFYAPRGEDE